MCTPTSLRRLLQGHRRRIDEQGFSLIEVLVAMGIFAVVSAAVLPLLLTSLKASTKARTETQVKDVAQLRLERMRNLAYHVDRQNGPFVDLLDRYYTNVSGTDTATGETDCTGRFLATQDSAVVGAPAGAAFRVTCTSLTGATSFTQRVYSQFLARTAVLAAVPVGYDSQVTGADAAPSQLLGVTLVTSWVRGGLSGRLRTYTEIADGRSNAALVTTQAQAIALRAASNDQDEDEGNNLVALAGQVKADGSLTTGSTASVQTVGASLEQSGFPTLSEAAVSAVSPGGGTPAGNNAEVGLGRLPTTGNTGTPWADCGWGWFGRSGYSGASSTIAAGVPVVPSTVGNDALTVGGPQTQAGTLRTGSGCAGYAFGFRNWLTSPAYQVLLGLSVARPLIYLPDASGGGDLATGLAVGGVAVSATDLSTTPNHASARATARTARVYLLPTLSHPDGLVSLQLNSASISCKSTQPVTASYNVTVWWPGGPASGTTYAYATGSAVPVLPAASSITFTEGTGTRSLADYLSWDLSTGVEEAASGASSIDHVVGISVPASVVGNGGFGLQLGLLSCAAADLR